MSASKAQGKLMELLGPTLSRILQGRLTRMGILLTHTPDMTMTQVAEGRQMMKGAPIPVLLATWVSISRGMPRGPITDYVERGCMRNRLAAIHVVKGIGDRAMGRVTHTVAPIIPGRGKGGMLN